MVSKCTGKRVADRSAVDTALDWMVIEKVILILKSDFLVYVLNFFSMSKDGLEGNSRFDEIIDRTALYY